jgi:hypothetical protein
VSEAKVSQPLRIVARAEDDSGVAWLCLRYRSVNQHQDHYRLRMLPTGNPNEYAATIPAEHVRSKWNLMYYIEAMDENGNGAITPGIGAPIPYIVVELIR